MGAVVGTAEARGWPDPVVSFLTVSGSSFPDLDLESLLA